MRKRKLGRTSWLDCAIFMGPAVLMFTTLFLIPLCGEVLYSFTDWNGVDPGFNFIGFTNYAKTFAEPEYWAYILSKDIPLRNLWRALIYVPRIIGGVILGFLWRFIFQNVFVQFGNWTGWSWFSQNWFTTPESSFWALVIVMTWTLSGYLMIIYGAGFSAIDNSYILRKVTIPMLMTSVTRCLFIAINWAMLLYDTNLSLTNGNPYRTSEAVTMNIYNTAFRSNQMSFGAAKSVVFIIVLVAIAFAQVSFTSRKEVEQ